MNRYTIVIIYNYKIFSAAIWHALYAFEFNLFQFLNLGSPSSVIPPNL